MHSTHLLIPSNVRTSRYSTATAPFSRLVQLQEGFGRTSESVSITRRRRSGTLQKYSIVQNAEQLLRLGLGRRSTGIRPGCGPALDCTRSERCGRRKVGAVRVEMALTVKEEVAAPSWESLAETLGGSEEKQKSLAGERLANAQERVFFPGEEPKLVFYRDSYSWSSDCQRVWLQLEEKKISHRVEKIDMSCYGEKPEWYKSMVPSGLLPAVKLDGEILTESVDIMFRLEEKFPDNNPLMPSRDAPEYEAVEELLNLEKTVVKAWINLLIQADSKDVEDGAFESAIDRVNAALMRFPGPYFLGSQFTLLDILFAPSLERIAASMPYWQGIRVRGTEQWPALNAWFDAMDARPSYQAMKSDDFGIAHNLEVQLGSCISSEAGTFYRALIDGTHGSWDLPLKPEETAWGFDDGTGRDGAKEEAAQSLIENHEEIVEYAIRYVIDGEKHKANVDRGFRYVAQALLMGIDNVELPKSLPSEVGVAATYLKDRVSVPRDMTYPAARQLRAHLQWLVKHTDLPLAVQQNRLNEDSGLNSWLYPSREELPDEKEMTIFDHLEELRDRLAISAGAIGAAIIGCFFFSKDLIKILEAPVYTQGVRFLQLSPGEFFFTTLKVSGYCGLLLGSPVLLYEIIAFVIPGLTRSERKFLGPIVLGSSVLFYAGVMFSYIVLTPAALNFFVNYAEGAVESFWSIDQYFEFVLVLLFSTGLSFQVPVIQLLLGQTRLVSGDQMLSVWRYVVVGSVAVAAVLTPSTDPLTQILLAGPLMGLYLGGAFLVKVLVPEVEPEADG